VYILVRPIIASGTPLPDLFDGRDYDEPWVFLNYEVAVDWCDFARQVYPEITHFDMTTARSIA
jgi:hypothetical protein